MTKEMNAYERDIFEEYSQLKSEVANNKEFYEGDTLLRESLYNINKYFGHWCGCTSRYDRSLNKIRYYDDLYDLIIDLFHCLPNKMCEFCLSKFPSKEYFEKREEERVNKKYKLYGTFTMFPSSNGYVCPVFEDEDHVLYIGDCSAPFATLTKYTSFVPIMESALPLVKPLGETDNVLACIQEYYKIGHRAIYATQYAKDKMFIGDLPQYINFITDFETDDENYRRVLDKELAQFDWIINGQWEARDHFENEAEFVDNMRKQKGVAL